MQAYNVKILVAVTAAILVSIFVICVVFVELKGGQAHFSQDEPIEKDRFYQHSATVDFCELNYAVSPYVVEFQNTITSLVISGIALYGFFTLPADYRLVSCLLCFTGIGSTVFHCTMLSFGQALDEVGMLGVILVMLQHSEKFSNRVCWAAFAVSCLIYFGFKNPAIFQVCFVSCILALILQTARKFDEFDAKATKEIMRSFFSFSIGATLWLLEPFTCKMLLAVSLHGIWHILAALGCLFWLRWSALTGKDLIGPGIEDK